MPEISSTPETNASPAFSAAELNAAFADFQRTVAQVGISRDWDQFANLFTENANYIEHALGTMHGREDIRDWIWKTMTAFPGSHMTGFPALWHVVDVPTARVICEVDNPMRDPGDGTEITATNITILTYAGNGLWACEEDIYNPLEFGAAAMRWCKKAADLGNLDEGAARWMHRNGPMFASGPTNTD